MKPIHSLLFALLVVPVAGHAAPPAPSVDTLKQVLTARLKKLLPDGMNERTVLFQAVQAGTPSGNTYPFRVTALVHDYGRGYPSNHYYGQTCLGHLDELVFTLSPDVFGGWEVQGAMTPPLSTRECKNNTAEGVSSIPLAGLQGSPAGAGRPAAAAAPAAGGQAPAAAAGTVATGKYECWANGEARPALNFTIRSVAQYVGSDGKPGTYSFAADSGRITFQGGFLAGAMPEGFYYIYHVPQGRPTLSIRSSRGSEASFCQKTQ